MFGRSQPKVEVLARVPAHELPWRHEGVIVLVSKGLGALRWRVVKANGATKRDDLTAVGGFGEGLPLVLCIRLWRPLATIGGAPTRVGLRLRAVSKLNQRVYDHIERWRNRPIETRFPYVYLDGLFLKMSFGDGV